jgi:hypothetical protein
VKRLLLAIASLVLIAGGCRPSSDFWEPTLELKAEIPPDYVTYTSEGLFSISYPPDLIIDNERMETYTEIPLKEIRPVFDGYIPKDEGIAAIIMVRVMPAWGDSPLRDIGFWTWNDISESEPEAVFYSQKVAAVDGRNAIILKYSTKELHLGEWCTTNLYTVKDGLVWWVTCDTRPEDLENYEDTFYNIFSSFKILTHWWSRWTM